jgi:hypothetical protein
MTTLDDLPNAALSLVIRSALTRHIPGTNRYAQVCRKWRDAASNSTDQEQLQLLLALEGLPADAVTSISDWLARHGACVTSLDITYNLNTAPLFQQLPLSTAAWVRLARLEVDGRDSLVALADALPQLVALTHLRASLCLQPRQGDSQGMPLEVPSGGAAPSAEVPCLQQLCPGLKSLHLDVELISVDDLDECEQEVDVPVVRLLPAALQQLHISDHHAGVWVSCAALVSFTALRRLVLDALWLMGDLNLLLEMPGLDQLDLRRSYFRVGYALTNVQNWLLQGQCAMPHKLTKLTGLHLSQKGLDHVDLRALLAAAPNLCTLRVLLQAPVAAGWVQQLSGLTSLQHLSIHFHGKAPCEAHAVVSMVTCVQQLTYLGLTADPGWVSPTWAALLPCFTQLRVLEVKKDHLVEQVGLAAALAEPEQLQCLYVQGWPGDIWDRHAPSTEVAARMQVLRNCTGCKAVLCWSFASDQVSEAQPPHPDAQPLRVVQHDDRLHLSCWHKWRRAADEGRVLCPRPCPHLLGVWEV